MPNIQNINITTAYKENIKTDLNRCHVIAGDMDYVCNPDILQVYNNNSINQIIKIFHSYLDIVQEMKIKFVSLYFRKKGLTEVEALQVLGRVMNDYKGLGFIVHFFDPKAVIAMLNEYEGIPLLNALTCEKASQQKGVSLLNDVHCPIIIQPIDDNGIAISVEKRFKIIKSVVHNLEKVQIERNLIYIDPLSPTIYYKPCNLDVSINTIRMCNKLNLKTILWPENTARGFPDKKNKIAECYTGMAIGAGLNFSVVKIKPFDLFPYIQYSNQIKNGVFL